MENQLNHTEAPVSEEIHEIRHGYEVGSYALMVPALTRAEVVQQPSICEIPSTPDWFAGFINHRGETVPVYDLNRYLSILDEDSPELSWVLLIDDHPISAGILLEKPPLSIIDPEQLETAAQGFPEVIAAAAGRVYQHDNKEWLEIDHQRLFMALKKQF